MKWWGGVSFGELLLIVLLINLVLFALGYLAYQAGWFRRRELRDHPLPRNMTRSDESLEIARQRYARGEVRREEFEQLKRDLA